MLHSLQVYNTVIQQLYAFFYARYKCSYHLLTMQPINRTMNSVLSSVSFMPMIYLFYNWKPVSSLPFTHFAHPANPFPLANTSLFSGFMGSDSAFGLLIF